MSDSFFRWWKINTEIRTIAWGSWGRKEHKLSVWILSQVDSINSRFWCIKIHHTWKIRSHLYYRTAQIPCFVVVLHQFFHNFRIFSTTGFFSTNDCKHQPVAIPWTTSWTADGLLLVLMGGVLQIKESVSTLWSLVSPERYLLDRLVVSADTWAVRAAMRRGEWAYARVWGAET